MRRRRTKWVDDGIWTLLDMTGDPSSFSPRLYGWLELCSNLLYSTWQRAVVVPWVDNVACKLKTNWQVRRLLMLHNGLSI